ncbi:MAG: hypothetical protein HY644_14250 [Acidobacteria bacterium]|nr:hypothetical protein [Acidobacteriota bacterium]
MAEFSLAMDLSGVPEGSVTLKVTLRKITADNRSEDVAEARLKVNIAQLKITLLVLSDRAINPREVPALPKAVGLKEVNDIWIFRVAVNAAPVDRRIVLRMKTVRFNGAATAPVVIDAVEIPARFSGNVDLETDSPFRVPNNYDWFDFVLLLQNKDGSSTILSPSIRAEIERIDVLDLIPSSGDIQVTPTLPRNFVMELDYRVVDPGAFSIKADLEAPKW